MLHSRRDTAHAPLNGELVVDVADREALPVHGAQRDAPLLLGDARELRDVGRRLSEKRAGKEGRKKGGK